jgi:hypothetical protein
VCAQGQLDPLPGIEEVQDRSVPDGVHLHGTYGDPGDPTAVRYCVTSGLRQGGGSAGA